MATPDPSDTVKDREYTNWLKVTLALYYMKSGLHTFIQSEVDCLHQSLVQKIYAGQPVPLSPCTTCNASLVRRNNHTRVWKFQTQCTLSCDVWFCELLALHNNPKSNKIYWANSDVSLWPFKPWECAKVFLPRGQQPTNTGPAESDAQALMVLLANCKHFHPKLSQQGQTLTHKISTIRNQVMHDGEMRVSDADRMSFIQQIIKLLEDPVCLKSLEDCKAAVSNIQKIETESLDVFFNVDNEMKSLKAAVNELRLEHGTQEKVLNTIDSLKEECKQLTEQLTKRFEKELKSHETRMDTIQRDVQSEKEETDTALKQQEEKCQEMHAAVTQLSETMDTMTTCVAQHESRFVAVEENVQAFGRKLEELETNILPQKENKSHGKRKGTGDGISDCCDMSEAPKRRKRTESDGLRQLKNQTEDNLDTFRMMGFISTSQTKEAKKLLEEKKSVVIKGNPGEGKTSTALYLIDNNNYSDQRVVIIRPKQWEKIDTDRVKIVVLEDIFGQYDLDPGLLQVWIDRYLQKIQNHVDEGKLQVVITIRDDIFSKASSKLISFKLFHSDRLLTLCSDELQNADKNSILNKELDRNNKDMNVHRKEQCISNFKGLIGFPQCCTLFARNEDLFIQGPDFFKSPEKFIVDNIRNLKADSFLSLAFLFCTYKIEEEYLSPSQIKECKKYLPVLQDIAQCFRISFDESNLISLRQSYEHYSGLYVKKVSSCQDHSVENLPYVSLSRGNFSKSCIQFSHDTVYEAVGQVLGDSYPEMVVKYGDSGYLYQRTYTADAKDNDSQNVFIPVSVFGLLAQRIVHDVVEKKIVVSVVKHSALKQNQFLMKLKDELLKGNRIRDFFIADPYAMHLYFGNVLKGDCSTFLQCVLQSDEDAVKLVYSHFMEFLACIHDNNSSDCWQCEEKQKLLELALYYHHFEIADQLITMNARYTHVSLCNASRHGDLSIVLTILEDLKRRQVFNPECIEAQQTLYKAYISGNQDVVEILLQEGITLHHSHVVDAVVDGDINVLMKVVEHLKLNKNWDPNLGEDMTHEDFPNSDMQSGQYRNFPFAIPCSLALYTAYCKERFDMADYLLKNEAKVKLVMLRSVSNHSSQQAVARLIQNLKDTDTWDPHCDGASAALETAYGKNKLDVCDLLIQEGVSLKMKNLSGVMKTHDVSLDSVEKVIQHLKDTHSWDLKCIDASRALQTAYKVNKVDACDLLIQEGVSLTMKDLASIAGRYRLSLESVKKSIQHLKDTDSWDAICDDASTAFKTAYENKDYDVCGLLVEEGFSCAIQYLHVVTLRSLDLLKTTVKQLKDIDSWDAKCLDASKALEMAYSENKHDVCHWLIQEGVSLRMKNLPNVTRTYHASLESIKKTIRHLKDNDCWDPKNVHASEALEYAYAVDRYNVCDLLIQEGVSLTMNTLLKVIRMRWYVSIESVKKIIQHLKDIDSWDPMCDVTSKALEVAFGKKFFDIFDLLFQEGVSLKMKHLPYVIERSQDLVKTAVKHLKDTNSWDAKCDDASKALAKAYGENQYDVCQLLIHEGVSLTMKNLPDVIITLRFICFKYFHTVRVSLESVKNAVRHLKDTKSWDAKSDGASEALGKAYYKEQYDVCQLLIQEGVSLRMKNLPDFISTYIDLFTFHPKFTESFKSVQKAIQYLKNTGSWDPKCNDASRALEKAYMVQKYHICDLLIEEGVSLTMKCLSSMPLRSIEYVKTAVKQLKDTDRWDGKCDDASKALAKAFYEEKTDVCDLLIQEGVSLKMINLTSITSEYGGSLESVQKAVQHLKDADSWDPKCDHASKALRMAYIREQYGVCHLLIQEGVSLTMSNLPSVFSTNRLALETAMKVIQHLKDTDSWDPKCDHAFKALEVADAGRLYDVHDLLIQEGVLHHQQ